MNFLDACKAAGLTPEAHLARSQDTRDLVPQPEQDKVKVGRSEHGMGVWPTDWFEEGQEIGLLLDMRFRRTAVLARYINHAHDPNTRMRPVYSRGMVLVATRPILLSDEITMDYSEVETLRTILREQGFP